MNWTEQQLEAITTEGSDILVSAAAGSGKTAVLTERIRRLVTEKQMPLEKMLVVTFTNAAASEMKEKILDALRKEESLLGERNDQDSERERKKKFVRKQIRNAAAAEICTFHRFAMDVIRRFFFLTDIDPHFTICEESYGSLLREKCLNDLFEEKYASGDPDFLAFMSSYTELNGETKAREMILSVYDFIMNMADPFDWLHQHIEELNCTAEQLEESQTCRILLEGIRKDIDQALIIAENLTQQIAQIPELDDREHVKKTIFQKTEENEEIIRELAVHFDEFSIEDLSGRMSSIKWTQMRTSNPEKESYALIKEQVSNQMSQYKELIKNAAKRMPAMSMEEAAERVRSTYAGAQVLEELVREFSERFTAAKREKNMLDFNDVEHAAYHILSSSEHPEAAEEYRNRFDVIFIDEYQDSSRIQEAMIQCVSRGSNVYMVGDVKQSIYKFRQADPDLFIRKYNGFHEGTLPGTRIDLSRNFRSKGGIIDAVNGVFRHIMTRELSGIAYDKAAELVQGSGYERGGAWDYGASLHLMDTAGDSEEELNKKTKEASDGATDSEVNGQSNTAVPNEKTKEASDGATDSEVNRQSNTAEPKEKTKEASDGETDSEVNRQSNTAEPKEKTKEASDGETDSEVNRQSNTEASIKKQTAPLTVPGIQKTNNEGMSSSGDSFDEEIAQYTSAELEGELISHLVEERLGRTIFDDKKGMERPIGYGDIVVLVRSRRNMEIYARALMNRGIPAYTSGGEGFYQAPEVQVMLDLLKVLNNHRRDKELISVLYSSIKGFRFTVNDLAEIRILGKELASDDTQSGRQTFSDAFFLLADTEPSAVPAESAKLVHHCAKAASQLAVWRKEVRGMPLDDFIWKLMMDTGYYGYVSALPGGTRRASNLRLLADRAGEYIRTLGGGLFSFLRFEEQIEGKGSRISQAVNPGDTTRMVQIMTIHNSKGLEFPIVFVPDLSAQIRHDSSNTDLQMHKDLGIALKYRSREDQIEYKTLPYESIVQVKKNEDFEEEKRILYVAMTRAKDELILTAAKDGIAESLEKEKDSSAGAVQSQDKRLSWIYDHAEEAGIPVRVYSRADLVEENKKEEVQTAWIMDELEKGFPDFVDEEGWIERIQDRMSYVYPYKKDSAAKSKYSVTELNRTMNGEDFGPVQHVQVTCFQQEEAGADPIEEKYREESLYEPEYFEPDEIAYMSPEDYAEVQREEYDPTAELRRESYDPSMEIQREVYDPSVEIRREAYDPYAELEMQRMPYDQTREVQREAYDPAAELRRESYDPSMEIQREVYDPSVEIRREAYGPYAEMELQRMPYDPSLEVQREAYDPTAELRRESYDPSMEIRREAYDPYAEIQRIPYDPAKEIQREAYDTTAEIQREVYDPTAEPRRENYDPSLEIRRDPYDLTIETEPLYQSTRGFTDPPADEKFLDSSGSAQENSEGGIGLPIDSFKWQGSQDFSDEEQQNSNVPYDMNLSKKFESDSLRSLVPSFLSGETEITPAMRGTLTHRVLELIDYSTENDEQRVTEFCHSLVKKGVLTEAEASVIPVKKIAAFFTSELGQRVCRAQKRRNEWSFTLRKKTAGLAEDVVNAEIARRLKENLPEEILVQGIIDCCFRDEKGIVIVDFKTDRVRPSDWKNDFQRFRDRYRRQLGFYRESIEKEFGEPVSEMYLYLLNASRAVLIE